MEKQEKKEINPFQHVECPFCWGGLARVNTYHRESIVRGRYDEYLMKCCNCGAHGALEKDAFSAYIKWAQLAYTFPVPKALLGEIIHQDMGSQPTSFQAVKQNMLNIKGNQPIKKKYQLFIHGLARAMRYYRDHLMDWGEIKPESSLEAPTKEGYALRDQFIVELIWLLRNVLEAYNSHPDSHSQKFIKELSKIIKQLEEKSIMAPGPLNSFVPIVKHTIKPAADVLKKIDVLRRIENYCESFFHPDHGGKINDAYRKVCQDILNIIRDKDSKKRS